jgi:hypothetical protein
VVIQIALLNSSLRGCQTGDYNSPWGAGDLVQADFVAEVDGLGIAAVLATDADLRLVATI